MEEGELLIAGIGSLGCTWAKAAQARVSEWVDLTLVDADESAGAAGPLLPFERREQDSWKSGPSPGGGA